MNDKVTNDKGYSWNLKVTLSEIISRGDIQK